MRKNGTNVNLLVRRSASVCVDCEMIYDEHEDEAQSRVQGSS
jgi:hypothetical protein